MLPVISGALMVSAYLLTIAISVVTALHYIAAVRPFAHEIPVLSVVALGALGTGVAFAYMADLSNVARWDPGVTRAEQVVGARPGTDAAFEVTVKGLPRPLRYVTNEYEPPTRVVLEARRKFVSRDTITVEAAEGGGSLVHYDAQLAFQQAARIAARAGDGGKTRARAAVRREVRPQPDR